MENPISGSEETYNLMKRSDKTNARFLIHNAAGISSLENYSKCTSFVIYDFILHGKLPPPKYRCEPQKDIFALSE
jgi:hypothetical protein